MSTNDVSIGMYIRYAISVSVVGLCLVISVSLCALEMVRRQRIMKETKVSFSKILPHRLNLISGLIFSSCLVSLCCQFLVQFGDICSFFSFFPHHLFLIGFAKMSFTWFQLERLSLIFGRNHSSYALQKYSYSSLLFNALRLILLLLLLSHSYNVMFQCAEISNPVLPAFVGCVSVQITPLTVINYGTLIVTEWIVLSLYVYRIHELSNDVQKENVLSLYALVQKIFVLSLIMESSFLIVVVFSLLPTHVTYPWREVADAIDQLITIRFVLLIMDHNLSAYNSFAKFWNSLMEHICCKLGQQRNYCVLHIIPEQMVLDHDHGKDTNTNACAHRTVQIKDEADERDERDEQEKKRKKSQLTPIAKIMQHASPTITCNFESTVHTIPSQEDDDEHADADGDADGDEALSQHLKQGQRLQHIKQATPSPDNVVMAD